MSVILKFINIVVMSYIHISLASNLIFVNILYRHGARTPNIFYPKDPNQHNEVFKKIGAGQLTDQGREEHIKLGGWLLERYSHLLTNPKNVHVQSTDVKRVKESAKCNLAAMFPAHGSHYKDKHGIHCTTQVPIYAVESTLNKVLAVRAPCPEYKKEYKARMVEEQNKRKEKFKIMFNLLDTEAGVIPEQLNVKFVPRVYDALHLEKEEFHLPLPQWTDKIYPEPLREATILRYTLSTWNTKLKRLGPGLLLQEMINNMENKANGKSDINANIYAAHDYTIVNLLNTLGVYDQEHLPPYAACIMMELWEEEKGKYHVKFFYKKSPDQETEQLDPLKCGNSCSLTAFQSNCKEFIPEDWKGECHEDSHSAGSSLSKNNNKVLNAFHPGTITKKALKTRLRESLRQVRTRIFNKTKKNVTHLD